MNASLSFLNLLSWCSLQIFKDILCQQHIVIMIGCAFLDVSILVLYKGTVE